jgi:CRISPR/Cas system-associated exonuclease Cas4 (RecB family)
MMSSLSNEYQNLLKYFDSQKQRKSPAKEVLEKKVKKIETETSETKKLLEESKIHSYIPGETFKKLPESKGFSIQKFETMMRSKLIEEHKKSQSYERPYISVSELTNCLRQCYYFRMRYPINLNKLYNFSYLFLMQKVGNKIHDVVQEIYGFSEIEKTIVSERFKVKGRVDGIQESFLFEIKSLDANKVVNTYIKEHYLQGLIYAFILNTEYEYKIETITIIYVKRDLKTVIPFDLPVDYKLAESLLNRAPILKSALESHQIPDPFGAIKEHCQYCLFKEQCKNDNPTEILQPFARKKKTVDPKKEKDKKTAFLL